MKISKLTLFYSLFLIISASFMRQVLDFIQSKLSDKGLSIFIWIIFIIVLISITYLVKKYIINQKKFLNLILLIIILLLAIMYAVTFEIIVERIHLILFGLLGFLIAKDNYQKHIIKILIISLLYCFVVACIDETFQYFLPYRYGDPRDIVFGTVGGLIGISLYITNCKV